VFLGKYEFMPLLLGREKLSHDMEVSRKTSDEWNTQQEEHNPHFVLDTELIPPVGGPSMHW
jgi:hypothetical protein